MSSNVRLRNSSAEVDEKKNVEPESERGNTSKRESSECKDLKENKKVTKLISYFNVCVGGGGGVRG